MNWRKPRRAAFRRLCALEPELLHVLKVARSIKDDGTAPSFCANAIWAGHPARFKGWIGQLVGWHRNDHPELGTQVAYEVACENIYSVLPNCRNCWCA